MKIIIYPANCADGLAAAWAIWSTYADDLDKLRAIPANYGDTPPDCRDAEVYIVDFSYPADQLKKIAALAAKLVVIDHHITAKPALEELARYAKTIGADTTVIFNTDKSGAQLACDFVGIEEPRLISHIADRDLWRFENPFTKQICAGFMAGELTLSRIDDLIVTDPQCSRLLDIGGHILADYDNRCQKLLAIASNVTLVYGGNAYYGRAVNAPGWYASEVGHQLADGFDFGLVWHYRESRYHYSLRGRDTGPSVGDIAKGYGGGGHRNAAGFTLTTLII